MPNEPLAGKFNEALRQAIDAGAIRIMILPSDDFVSPAWVEAARDEAHGDYIVPHTCGIIDLASLEAFAITKLSFTGTLKFGAGRVVSRKAVEACGGQLWPQELNRGLDSASHHRLMAHGIKHTVITTEGIPITDVKTYRIEDGKQVSDNLWPFQVWENGSRPMTADQALHMLSAEHRAMLEEIRVTA